MPPLTTARTAVETPRPTTERQERRRDDEFHRMEVEALPLEPPYRGGGPTLKRTIDVVVASLGIILLSPLHLGIAVLVKVTSPGPVFFRQQRYGFSNEVFSILKFRTMHHVPADQASNQQATRNDPRITPVGRFLRSTSLDELPQLFNILQGKMSLVGPRPHPVHLDDHYAPLIDNYWARHRMKPGITGLAQVSGLRGAIDTAEKMRARIKYDNQYIDQHSTLLDLKILALTALVILDRENAY